MTSELRKVTVVRVYAVIGATDTDVVQPEGLPKDHDVWVDFEEIDQIWTEVGYGPTFQRLRWIFDALSEERRAHVVRLRNPTDDTQFLKRNTSKGAVIDTILVDTGDGPEYQRVTWQFDDSVDNVERKVQIERVYNSEIKDGKVTVDKGQYLDCELIESFLAETGDGPEYQLQRLELDTIDVPNFDGLVPHSSLLSTVMRASARARFEDYPSKRLAPLTTLPAALPRLIYD